MDALEEQQLTIIKKWWERYGKITSISLSMVLGIIVLIQYGYHHKKVLNEQASEHYIALSKALDDKDEVTFNQETAILLQQYPRSIYATFAGFFAAKEALHKEEDAEVHLRTIIQKSPAPFKTLAQIRLMRLLINQQKLDEALALYDEEEMSFLPLMAELKGDILVKKNDLTGAKEAYIQAIKLAPQEGMYGPLLKMKLNELPLSDQEKEE